MTKFKRVCFHILCGFIPSKQMRRKFRKYAATYRIFDNSDLYYRRAAKMLHYREKIENLVLGSSYGLYGFAEENEKDFNLALPSQDLYYSEALYDKFGNMRNLKNVILFYFTFSAGLELDRTGDRENCVYYKLFFGIPYKTPFLALRNGLLKLEKQLVLNASFADITDLSPDYTDMVYTEPMTEEVLHSRVNGHMKNARRGNNQNFYLERMAEKARRAGHRLFVVIPPVTEKYRALMPPFEEAFEPLLTSLAEIKDNIRLLNFLGDSDFTDEDFNDFDHLNRHGAEKLTAKIKAALK